MYYIRPYSRRDYVVNQGNTNSIKTDIKEAGDSYFIYAELPGFTKEEVSVKVNDNRLTISAESKANNAEDNSKVGYIRKERTHGKFSRSFDVTGICTEDIKVKLENGILEIILPKVCETKPKERIIDIN